MAGKRKLQLKINVFLIQDLAALFPQQKVKKKYTIPLSSLHKKENKNFYI